MFVQSPLFSQVRRLGHLCALLTLHEVTDARSTLFTKMMPWSSSKQTRDSTARSLFPRVKL